MFKYIIIMVYNLVGNQYVIIIQSGKRLYLKRSLNNSNTIQEFERAKSLGGSLEDSAASTGGGRRVPSQVLHIKASILKLID